jgi:putative membrane protein
MAAERTFLAWIRTGLALMGFGFVVARFGLFLREVGTAGELAAPPGPGVSLPLGVTLIIVGIVVNVVSAVRHRRYVQAIDDDRFRLAFGSGFASGIAAVIALVGIAMALYLTAM